MGARRSWPHAILRIGIVLAAGGVVGAAAPRSTSGATIEPLTCRSRSDCGPLVMGGLQITFTGWSCTTGFVAGDTETHKVVVLTAGHCVAGSGLLAPVGSAFATRGGPISYQRPGTAAPQCWTRMGTRPAS
jgi:hypothetical protein